MIITICTSLKYYADALGVQKQLENLGHEVLIPPQQVKNESGDLIPVQEIYHLRKEALKKNENSDWLWQRKKEAMNDHFEKVNKADAILVLNFTKDGIDNYIGGNVFLEMGLAFWLNKPIYLLNPIPTGLSYAEELKGMQPIVINGDLNLIR